MAECPSAAHGTNRDPYGCYEREQAAERAADRAHEREQRLLAQAEEAAVFDFLQWLAPQNIELHQLIPGGCSEAEPGPLWDRWKAERRG